MLSELTISCEDFGQLIMYNMALFVGFYAAAILRRNRPEVHKRMMVLASASALVAALCRTYRSSGSAASVAGSFRSQEPPKLSA